MKSRKFLLIIAAVLTITGVRSQELLNYPLDTIDGEEVYRYEVERSIGLYRIGINFNVPQSEIIRLNPQLRERGLHYGETLLIPTKRKIEKHKKAPVIPAIRDTIISEIRDSVIPEVQDTAITSNRQVIELALLLPFESQQLKRSVNAERMMEFYQGALIALSERQNDSTLFRLRVYDTERSERRVNALCDSTELDSVRAIIGPVYPIQIERMATWCDVHQVPLILPFSDNIDLEAHPYALQFNSTAAQEADSLCRWMAAREDSIHCVAIDVRESDLSSTIRTLRHAMKAQGIACAKIAMRDLLNDSAAYALDSAKENLIIIHSDRYQHIRVLLPHLYKLQEEGYKIRLVSRYAWLKEEIRLPQVYTSVFTRTGEWEPYEALWADYFTASPTNDAPRYDLLGYDLMAAALAWLRGEQGHTGLQSEIRWTKVRNGGHQNACVYVIEK